MEEPLLPLLAVQLGEALREVALQTPGLEAGIIHYRAQRGPELIQVNAGRRQGGFEQARLVLDGEAVRPVRRSGVEELMGHVDGLVGQRRQPCPHLHPLLRRERAVEGHPHLGL